MVPNIKNGIGRAHFGKNPCEATFDIGNALINIAVPISVATILNTTVLTRVTPFLDYQPFLSAFIISPDPATSSRTSGMLPEPLR